MAIIQSIDSALEKQHRPARRRRQGAGRRARARAKARSKRLRARHADGGLPLLRLPETRDDLPAIRDAGQRLAEGATDIVLLGTGGSSLGGQTLAQLAGYAVPGVGALRSPPRLHFMDNLDAGILRHAARPSCRIATTRFVAISKSGGTAETLMQTIAALSAAEGGRPRDAHPRYLPRPHRAGQSRQAQRPARSARQTSRADARSSTPGVGGRFSALTNVGLLPAAMLGLDIAAMREGAALALAPVLAKKKPAEVPAALGAALAVALAESKGKTHQRADGLCRPAGALHALVRAALGREPRQERQGHHAGRRRSARSISTARCNCIIGGPRDKLFTVVTVDGAGLGPRIDGELAKLAGEPDFGGKTIGDLVAAEGRATAETLGQERLPGAHAFICRGSTRRASANC